MVEHGALAVNHLRGGDGVIADDDFAGDVDRAGAIEAAIGTHGHGVGFGLAADEDAEGAGLLLDGVGIADGQGFAAIGGGGGAIVEAEVGAGGIFVKAGQDDSGGARAGDVFRTAEADEAHKARSDTFAHTGDVAAAELEAAAGGDGGGIVGEALRVGGLGL